MPAFSSQKLEDQIKSNKINGIIKKGKKRKNSWNWWTSCKKIWTSSFIIIFQSYAQIIQNASDQRQNRVIPGWTSETPTRASEILNNYFSPGGWSKLPFCLPGPCKCCSATTNSPSTSEHSSVFILSLISGHCLCLIPSHFSKCIHEHKHYASNLVILLCMPSAFVYIPFNLDPSMQLITSLSRSLTR